MATVYMIVPKTENGGPDVRFLHDGAECLADLGGDGSLWAIQNPYELESVSVKGETLERRKGVYDPTSMGKATVPNSSINARILAAVYAGLLKPPVAPTA